jgi:hypothetical protein
LSSTVIKETDMEHTIARRVSGRKYSLYAVRGLANEYLDGETGEIVQIEQLDIATVISDKCCDFDAYEEALEEAKRINEYWDSDFSAVQRYD